MKTPKFKVGSRVLTPDGELITITSVHWCDCSGCRHKHRNGEFVYNTTDNCSWRESGLKPLASDLLVDYTRHKNSA